MTAAGRRIPAGRRPRATPRGSGSDLEDGIETTAASPLTPQNAGPRLALGAVVRNEAPYLLEWIAYHRLLGVERFFVADDGSTDGTTELLEALEATAGDQVRRLALPRTSGPPQLPAYAAILARHGAEADWIAFIDADEFLLPTPATAGLGDTVAAAGADPAVGSIAVNWACFGSSGRVAPGFGLVIERFQARAAQSFPPNHHVKSIVRPAAVDGPGPNPHVFALRPGFRCVRSDGRSFAEHPLGIRGFAAEIVWSPLRLNHYLVKSREEFVTGKMPRGRATVRGAARDLAFFAAHDRNERRDGVPAPLVAATRRAQAALARRIAPALGLDADSDGEQDAHP